MERPQWEKVDPSGDDNIALFKAIGNDHGEIVKLLLADERVDATARNNAALRYALEEDNLMVIQSLIDGGVDPTGNGWNDNEFIQIASERGNPSIVKVLLEWEGPEGDYVNPNANNGYAIRIAAKNNHNAVMKVLLNSKVPDGNYTDPTVMDDEALYNVSYNRNLKGMKILLRWRGPEGERVDVKSGMKGAREGNEEVLDILMGTI